MKKNDSVHLFRILDEVGKNGEVTQRCLSQRLGVALGLTNLYVRRLAKRGLIKVINLKPNRLRYELTPSGIAQKTTMAFQSIQESYVFYREARRTLTATFEAMKRSGVRSVVLFGATDLAEIALLSLQEADLVLVGVVSRQHEDKSLCGRPVLPPESLLGSHFDRVVIVDPERDAAVKRLSDLGITRSRVVMVGV